MQVRFSRCIVSFWDSVLQPRERKEGRLIISPAQIGHCRGEQSEKVAQPQSGHGSAASASEAFEREPLAVQYSSGQHCKYKSWGLWLQLGIELGRISLRNEQKWLLLRFMSHLPSLVCIDGHGKGQTSITQGCKCDCWAFFRFLLESICSIIKNICHKL